jgi:hypothetical protein
MRALVTMALAVAAGVWWWNDRAVDLGQPTANGFVSATMPDGAPRNAVIILAPQNCPSDAAQRAAHLARSLTDAGIPNVLSSSYSVDIENPTEEQRLGMERAVAIMNGEIPAVFVKGKAKANPTVAQVLAEYRGK